jgi:crotonobetainyl-CoA:carnitine CoA-transferase CaiB-like acyl-CoA transferase
MSARSPAGALGNLLVLDITRVRAGPTCCRVLADFGADVLKIEAPEGADPNAGATGSRDGFDMQNLHRNKRSLTLNLKTSKGREIFMRLVAQADMVVENFRPDVKFRLGIDYERLRAVNPRIILVSISGFGQDGPYRERAGYDQIAQGMGGLMSVTGLPGQGPTRAGIAIADVTAGIYAATGALVAVAERERSGEGQWVQTSLLQAQIAVMDFQAARFLIDGEVPGQAGNDHPVTAPMGMVNTRDGEINIGVGGDRQWQALCALMDRPDLAAAPEYASAGARSRNKARLKEVLAPLFLARDSHAWLEALEAQGIPAGPVYTVDQVFDDPQVRHLGMATTVTHKRRGEIRVVAQPIVMSRTPATVTLPTPDAGEHTDEILETLGFTAADIDQLRSEKVI